MAPFGSHVLKPALAKLAHFVMLSWPYSITDTTCTCTAVGKVYYMISYMHIKACD